jgi:hypothetical protein
MSPILVGVTMFSVATISFVIFLVLYFLWEGLPTEEPVNKDEMTNAQTMKPEQPNLSPRDMKAIRKSGVLDGLRFDTHIYKD